MRGTSCFFKVALAFMPANPAVGGMDRTSSAISRAKARRYIVSHVARFSEMRGASASGGQVHVSPISNRRRLQDYCRGGPLARLAATLPWRLYLHHPHDTSGGADIRVCQLILTCFSTPSRLRLDSARRLLLFESRLGGIENQKLLLCSVGF